MAAIVVFKLLWVGVNTTRMQEHGLRHILLLKKAQLCNVAKPLFFSVSRTVPFLVPSTFTMPELQAAIEAKIGISVSNQRISVHGVTASAGSGAQKRARYEKKRSSLIKKAIKKDLTPEQLEQLEFYQMWFRKDDSLRSVQELCLYRRNLVLEQEEEEQAQMVRQSSGLGQSMEVESGWNHWDHQRLSWIEDYLPATVRDRPVSLYAAIVAYCDIVTICLACSSCVLYVFLRFMFPFELNIDKFFDDSVCACSLPAGA